MTTCATTSHSELLGDVPLEIVLNGRILHRPAVTTRGAGGSKCPWPNVDARECMCVYASVCMRGRVPEEEQD